MSEEKVFFYPGDVVTLRQKELLSPNMLVVGKESRFVKSKDSVSSDFKGIKCRWFTSTFELRESIFNTKDLIKVNTNE